jgi:hypothetical protein
MSDHGRTGARVKEALTRALAPFRSAGVGWDKLAAMTAGLQTFNSANSSFITYVLK